MKEELQSKLVEILTSIQGAVGKASDFAMDQIPDVALQYVLYGRISATVEAVVWFILFVLIVYASIKLTKKAWEEDPGTGGFFAFIGTGFSLFTLIATVSQLQSTLLVWLAPKVWLLKEIARMVK